MSYIYTTSIYILLYILKHLIKDFTELIEFCNYLHIISPKRHGAQLTTLIEDSGKSSKGLDNQQG